ncbi:hypothetical protein [Agrobacterium sp. NPDC090283]|uniref:hypothetical protein n=1 Tax=Agrobacterium sp. NPDC090283 TaxID=3363920 RepID=UPI00383AB990
MNGAHDLGGMHGFGPIAPPKSEPVFKHDWERRMFAIHVGLCFAAAYNIDEHRHGCERMNGSDYLSTTYYEHWLHANEVLLVEKGVFTQEEYEAKLQTLKDEA